MIRNTFSSRVIFSLGLCLVVAGQVLAADVYQATAKFKNAAGKQESLKVTISLDAKMPESDRLAVTEKVKSDPASAKTVLAGQPQIGYIEAGDRRVPIRYAFVSASLGGQTIRAISNEPLGFIGGAKKDAKPKEGYDLTYVMVTIKDAGKSEGEMGPATKVKWMDSGAPAPDRYDNKIVWLEDVTKVTKP